MTFSIKRRFILAVSMYVFILELKNDRCDGKNLIYK